MVHSPQSLRLRDSQAQARHLAILTLDTAHQVTGCPRRCLRCHGALQGKDHAICINNASGSRDVTNAMRFDARPFRP
jgi:hypothetical protein